jgi:hypothetical protein
MRYRLRTLLILLAVGPPLVAALWWHYHAWQADQLLRTYQPPLIPRGAPRGTQGPHIIPAADSRST